jgi:hypothetical protein
MLYVLAASNNDRTACHPSSLWFFLVWPSSNTGEKVITKA